MNIAEMQERAYNTALANGFWDVPEEELYQAALYAKLFMKISIALEYGRCGNRDSEVAMLGSCLDTLMTLQSDDPYYERPIKDNAVFLSKLALIISEIGEAAEPVFHGGEDNSDEELADAIIRIGDLAGGFNIDLDSTIEKKMTKNEGRPRLHGKAF